MPPSLRATATAVRSAPGPAEVLRRVGWPLVYAAHLAAARRPLREAPADLVEVGAHQLDEAVPATVRTGCPLAVLRDICVVRWAVQNDAASLAEKVVGKREQ